MQQLTWKTLVYSVDGGLLDEGLPGPALLLEQEQPVQEEAEVTTSTEKVSKLIVYWNRCWGVQFLWGVFSSEECLSSGKCNSSWKFDSFEEDNSSEECIASEELEGCIASEECNSSGEYDFGGVLWVMATLIVVQISAVKLRSVIISKDQSLMDWMDSHLVRTCLELGHLPSNDINSHSAE